MKKLPIPDGYKIFGIEEMGGNESPLGLGRTPIWFLVILKNKYGRRKKFQIPMHEFYKYDLEPDDYDELSIKEIRIAQNMDDSWRK